VIVYRICQARFPNNDGEGAQINGGRWNHKAKLPPLVAELDALSPIGKDPNADQLAAIVDLCAWAHAEWIRIHPFANGNGRTARLWTNWLAVRYGLPPFIRLRPKPDSGYGNAGSRAMQGGWKPTAVVFHQLLDDLLDGY
jgi:hypothetical protein